jgi:hypothetical protein
MACQLVLSNGKKAKAEASWLGFVGLRQLQANRPPTNLQLKLGANGIPLP